MNLDDPKTNGLIRAVSRLCNCPDYFDGHYPTPQTYEEYVETPILDGVERYTREQLEGALGEIQAEQADAATRKIWKTVADFWVEFTTREQYAIQASVNPTIVVARGQLAMWRGEVWSDDPRVIGGLDAMIAAGGIIDAARKAAILAL